MASSGGGKSASAGEFPWVAVDRGLLPVVFSHAAAALISGVINTLGISDVSCCSLFLCFLAVSLTAVFFYHNIKVTVSGKAVLVTGCDAKLGATIAKQLHDLGFTVFAGCLRPDAELPSRLNTESSSRLHVFPLDVTSEEQVQDAVALVTKNLPHGASGLWAVLHCASWAAFGEVEWAPFAAFRRSAEVNLLGAVRVTQAFLPHLRSTRGRVISVVSLLGRVSSPARAPYCAAKFAVESFADCLRLEMRRYGVDVVLVEPGDTLTGSLEWFSEERVLRQAREAWEKMNTEQRREYGEQHFVDTVRAVHDYTLDKVQGTEMGPVLKALVEATTRSYPLPRYQVLTPAEWLRNLVAEHLPRSVYDILYN